MAKVYRGNFHTEIVLEMLVRIWFGLKVNSMSFTFVPMQSLLPTCCETGLRSKYFRNQHDVGCQAL